MSVLATVVIVFLFLQFQWLKPFDLVSKALQQTVAEYLQCFKHTFLFWQPQPSVRITTP